MLHLTGRHPDLLHLMAGLIPPPFMAGVREVRPVRLDRFGVVLRLLRTSTERDVRLRFRAPLTRPDGAHASLKNLHHT